MYPAVALSLALPHARREHSNSLTLALCPRSRSVSNAWLRARSALALARSLTVAPVLGIEELITYDRYANQHPPPWPLSRCVPCCHSDSLSLLLTLARSRYLPARLLHVERADEASEPARGFAPLACFTRKVLVARSMSVRSRERAGLLQALTLARQTISLNCGSCQWCETATTFLFVPVSTILNAYNSF